MRALILCAVVGVFVAGFSTSAGASASGRLSAGPAGIVRPVGSVAPFRTAAARQAGTSLLQYWGGPVMRTNTTYAIYWLPSGTSLSFGGNNASYENTVNQFLTDVGHDSGGTANVFGIDTQYYDTLSGGQTHIAYNSTFGGSVVATDPLPAQQCSDGTTYCVTDAQLKAEIAKVVTAQGWPQDTSHLYFVLTPSGLGSCFGTGTSTCAYSYYCAYHSAFSNGGGGTIAYGNEPYLFGSGGCDTGQYPNGSGTHADPTINVLSHEFNEAITDPVPNSGWADSSGAEIGDKCAWLFGATSGAAGAKYNQTINGHHYYLQQEFDNSTDACQLQAASVGTAPSVGSVSPGTGKDGAAVTINGSGFTGATSVKFNGTAASFTVASDAKITTTVPAGATSGTITVTTAKGTGTSSTSFLVLPTVTSFAPPAAKIGASVTISGSGLTGATSVKFNGTAATAFTVNADNKITVKVPTGATSGLVTVTTPSGAGTSTTAFTVQGAAPGHQGPRG